MHDFNAIGAQLPEEPPLLPNAMRCPLCLSDYHDTVATARSTAAYLYARSWHLMAFSRGMVDAPMPTVPEHLRDKVLPVMESAYAEGQAYAKELRK